LNFTRHGSPAVLACRALAINVLVLAALAPGVTPASAPLARAAPVRVPATVAREVHPTLDKLLEGAGGSVTLRNGVIRTSNGIRTAEEQVCPGFWFTSVGLTWRQSGGGPVGVAIRTSRDGSSFGPAADLVSEPDEGPSPGSPDYHPGRPGTDLLWTGGGRCVRFSLRLPADAALSGLTVDFANMSGTAAGPGTGPPQAPIAPALAATTQGRPAIITRAQWGADPQTFDTESPGCRAPYYSPRVKVAYVHHTAGSNSYSPAQADDVVRSVYWFHTVGRGFCDVAYSFLISRYGQVFEGRAGGVDRPVTPGSQAGFNPNTFSASMMGNFDVAPVPAAAIMSLERLLAWRLDVAHVPPRGSATMVSQGGDTNRFDPGRKVTMPTIVGHRFSGLTSCPGRYLWARLGEIRRSVAAMRHPRILRPGLSRSRIRPGGDVRITATATETLRWTVRVQTRSGRVVRRITHAGARLSAIWRGSDGHKPASPGKYLVRIEGEDHKGRVALPAALPLDISGTGLVSGPAGKPLGGTRRVGKGFRLLRSIDGTGPRDIWAVGTARSGPGRGHTLIAHRGESPWRFVPSPDPGAVSGGLVDVSARTAGDAWAVGYRCSRASCAGGGFGERALTLHWDGATWKAIPTANPGTATDRLNAVAAIAKDDVWAIGDASDEGRYLHHPLLEHWNGTRWTAFPGPRFSDRKDIHLSGLSAVGPGDVWALGHVCFGDVGCGGAPRERPVVLHWDGAHWSVVRTAHLSAFSSSLEAVTAISRSLVWAVGDRSRTRETNSQPLIERWNGSAWRVVSSPRAGPHGGSLWSVGRAPGSGAWTGGDQGTASTFRPFVQHHRDAGWRTASSPGAAPAFVTGLGVRSATAVWAVGPSPAGVRLWQWNGSGWRAVSIAG
jgi:hypothetical protein